MGANKRVERARRRCGRVVDPRSRRPRRGPPYVENPELVAPAAVSAASRHDERRPREGRQRGRGSVRPGGTAEEPRGDRVTYAPGSLVDHHRDGSAAPKNRQPLRQRALRWSQPQAETSASVLPESIERRHAQALGDHEKLAPASHRAGRQVPVSGVGSGDDDPTTGRPRLTPERLGARLDRHTLGEPARSHPEKLEGRRPEGCVHRRGRRRGGGDVGGAHGREDVGAPDAQNCAGEPPQRGPAEPERSPREHSDGGRQDAQNGAHGSVNRIRPDARPCPPWPPPREQRQTRRSGRGRRARASGFGRTRAHRRP